MLILRGWASIVGLVAAGLLGAGLESVTDSRAISYFVAGVALAAFGWFVNANADHKGHALFWIPIQYWGVAVAIGALAGA